MLGTDVMAHDDVDKLVAAFEAGDDHVDGSYRSVNRRQSSGGTSPLNINYDAENDEGMPLTRGLEDVHGW